MAYQTRQRDPLLDSSMQEMIEKRGKELFGLGLVILGLLALAMAVSYTPSDPSFLSVTDAPVQNWLGQTGASIAAPVFMIVGWGALAFAALLVGWGLRFVFHRGADRAVPRLMLAPVWVVLMTTYVATLVPYEGWTQDSGLGGHLGDMLLGMFLGLLPLSQAVALKALSLLMGPGVLAMGAFVLGFTGEELRRGGRFVLVGLIRAYDAVMTLMGRGAGGAMAQARAFKERRAQEDVVEDYAPAATSRVIRHDAHYEPEEELVDDSDYDAAPRGGLRRLMPGLLRRQPEPMPDLEPELVETPAPDFDIEAPQEDRIKARITSVVRTKLRRPVETETPLTRGMGRRPDPLVLKPRAAAGEPPLTAAHAAPQVQAPLATPEVPVAEAATVAAVAPVAVDPHAALDALPQLMENYAIDSEAIAKTATDFRPAPAPEVDEQIDEDFDDGDYGYDDAAPSYDLPKAEPRKAVVHQPQPKPVQPSRRAMAEAQPSLFQNRDDEYELPPLSLLRSPESVQKLQLSNDALEANARMLETVLDDYGVKGEIVSVRPGPVVTMYELEPAPGLKASRVIGLADDIARSMSALSARVSTVPGRSVIGIELPNETREMVVFREILSSRAFGDHKLSLPLALGKDIGGDPVVANLAKMPHLLIAGTTGSGKSVAINTMILSLLYKLSPEECRLIMIDPKMLELSVYDGIPHLLSPVVTDPKKAVVALKWVVAEMEERYRKMSKMGVRNIDGYNSRVKDALSKGEMFSRTVQTGFDEDSGDPVFETEHFAPEKMPYIVVIVDEMADLMMVAGKEIEACIQRLAQMARASGIHLIMATQRPSVDVITGTIKANFPTRISFQVTSKIDSRTILGEQGAEQLLGMGDMLYMAGGGRIQRCHGPFVSDEEVEEIVNHLKAYGPPEYVNGVQSGPDAEKESELDQVLGLSTGGNTGSEDALYDQAVQIVIKDRKCSTSYIQRKLGIGYNKAARLVEQMEENSLVSSANHVGKREILVPEQD
ncbi:MAG: DNA translocase FtsK 4TM domain-containing protein [Pseudomonadota bacterium]|nr:DNA translocase FtsK 4TM domain-containing protein [Pseudomonadota bacterium]MEE3071395.1 DNA translocase FtsK 4TM domain-containing protein [Pseudomonadota bacterium]